MARHVDEIAYAHDTNLGIIVLTPKGLRCRNKDYRHSGIEQCCDKNESADNETIHDGNSQ